MNGFVVDPEQSRRLSAADLRSRYRKHGTVDLGSLDGSFVIVVVDLAKNRLTVRNDRLGTLPLYFHHDADSFSFGPEAKAVLATMTTAPSLSVKGITSFLACGYCLGEQTLFEGVRACEPGTQITVDMSSLVMKIERYWRMVYSSRPELKSRRAAESALYSELVAAHALMLRDGPSRHYLLLSGGMDSRGILGFLSTIGALPHRALGWGFRNDLPGSDPEIAGRLARLFGVPYDFYSFEPRAFIENARAWTYVSELANDNPGWYAEGAAVLATHWAQSECTFIGDEAWGWRGRVGSEAEARAAVLPSRLPTLLRDLLTEHARQSGEATYDDAIRGVLGACENEAWDDRKDFLYLHGRVARFIFSLGYYRELGTELRRPFMTGRVLDVIAGLPSHYRWNKNLYVSMLRRFYPNIMAFDVASTNSLADWPYDVRSIPELREMFLTLLQPERVLSGPLGEILDPDRYVQVVEGFFSTAAVRRVRTAPPKSQLSAHVPELLKHKVRQLRGRPVAKHDDVFQCIFRLVQLSLLRDIVPVMVPTYGGLTPTRS